MLPFIIVSAIFLGISFLLNADNASGLLAGYNTLSDERKATYDIKKVVAFTNNTLRVTALGVLLGGAISYWFQSGALALFTLLYFPLILILGGNLYCRLKFSTDPIRKYEKIVFGLLIFVMLYLAFAVIPWNNIPLEHVININ